MKFEENKHPRDSDGKFTDKNGKTATDKVRESIKKYSDSPAEDMAAMGVSKPKELDELLGEEFKNVKGQAAIDKLLKEKRGHIKGAFHRDDIGDIDLLWGDDTLGLQHIIMRREEQGINVTQFLQDISDVVEKGYFKKKNDRGNFEFWYDGKLAVIAPEYHSNKITYLLTAYKQSRKNYKTP